MLSVNLKVIIRVIVIYILFSSCSFNKAYFDTSEHGVFFPDSLDYEEIYLSNRNGIKLYACLMKPKTIPRGTVFLLSDNSGDVKLWYDVSSVMLKHGFQVFSFDYQGFGNSEGKPTHKNILSDSQLMLNYLCKRDDIKNVPLIGWGFGIGGNLAVKLAYDNPYTFNYLILDSPTSSQRDMVLNNTSGLIRPFVFPFTVSQYASKKLIQKIKKTPVLIVHSLEDQIVPYKMGEEVFQKANNPKLFFEALGPHGYTLIDYEKLYMERVEKLLH